MPNRLVVSEYEVLLVKSGAFLLVHPVLFALGNGAQLVRTFRESYTNNIMAPGTRNNANTV